MKKKVLLSLLVLLSAAALPASAATNPRWIKSISGSPAFPVEGSTVVFSAEFQVSMEAVTNLTVVGGVDGVNSWSQNYPSLNHNQRVICEFRWRAVKGKHRIHFDIDPNRTSGDANTDDNHVEMEIEVKEMVKAAPMPNVNPATVNATAQQGGLPDLIITEDHVWNTTPKTTVLGLDEGWPGDTFAIEVEIQNIGQAVSATTQLKIDVQHFPLENNQNTEPTRSIYKTIRALKPYERTSVYFEEKLRAYGTHRYFFHVNRDNNFKEFNTDNNRAQDEVYIQWARGDLVKMPDLEVTLTSPDTTRRIGRSVTFKIEVKNIGYAYAAGFVMTFACGGKDTITRTYDKGLSAQSATSFTFSHRWSTRGTRTCTVKVLLLRPNARTGHIEQRLDNNQAQLQIRIR